MSAAERDALEAAREFAGNFIRYVADDEHLLAEQAWDVVRKVNEVLAVMWKAGPAFDDDRDG